MIYSMTGWGKAVCELPGKKISIEIKSLNSKQLDLSVRMPSVFKDKELELRNIISEKLLRGKVDLSIMMEQTSKQSSAVINADVLKQYFDQLKKIASELNIPLGEEIMPGLLRLPDVLSSGTEESVETDWPAVMNAVAEALEGVMKYRLNEGKVLELDFMDRIRTIENLIPDVEKFESRRIQKIRDKILSSLEGINLNGSMKIDKDRFEQELIYYLEKIDITEEKVRLRKNCQHFNEVALETGVVGKKLGFVVQEIGREINTLGSKANDSDMQKIVVQMKDELEKVKEQLMNIL
jgi:uncharacterized protein (TIGR00255 family)